MTERLRVLISGAGSGLGLGTAMALADRGHEVFAGAIDDDEVARLATGLPCATPVRLDVTESADRRRAGDLAIDVLVNNAGVPLAGPLRSVPETEVRRAFEVNVFGTLGLTQAVLPGMKSRGRGRVLIVSSVAGVLAGPMTGPYAMTKHALQAMGLALRAEMAPAGIDIALVNPGPFATGFNDVMIEQSTGWFDRGTAWPGEVELLEDARQRITGAQLDPTEAVDAIVRLVEAPTTESINFIPPDIVERIRGH